MDIRLRPLRDEEFETYLAAQRAEYARGLVEEHFRGRGLGRKALELIEEEARAEDLRGIDLNVWGGNDAARALYRTAGYYERAVSMSKELA